ncbi:MAG: hypothetical protein M3Z26_03250 [Bacteroidota bacterium]|nr:hypothetical protein [Bacteroidota bacterium]
MILKMKIISGILILITVFLNVKHGWSGLTNSVTPEESKMFADLGINRSMGIIIAVLTLVAAVLILFPQTFFIGNLINAAIILSVLALALKTGNIKLALIEIPFLLMPLVMIYLGHPFKK